MSVTPIPRKIPVLYVLWRIDGDFTLTELDTEHAGKSPQQLITLCIREEQKTTAGMTEEDVQNDILAATDPDAPTFKGYEMPLIFLSADALFYGI